MGQISDELMVFLSNFRPGAELNLQALGALQALVQGAMAEVVAVRAQEAGSGTCNPDPDAPRLPSIAEVLNSPHSSDWLKKSLRRGLKGDLTVAWVEACLLAEVLRREAQREGPEQD